MNVTSWLRYLIAFVVAGHAFVYLGPASPVRAFREWAGSSWLLGQAFTAETLRALATGLHVVTGLTTLALAATIAFAPSVPGWWRTFGLVAGGLGILAFAVFWDGRAQFLFHEGAVGALISLIILASVFVFARAFA